MQCPSCNSYHVQKRSIRTTPTGSKQRYACMECKKWFSTSIDKDIEFPIIDSINTIPLTSTVFEEQKINVGGITRFVVTSCQNNATVNEDFLNSLQSYCEKNNARLLIVPIVYRPGDHHEIKYNIPEHINHTLVTHRMKLHEEVFVMGSFNFIPTTVNPLQGLQSLSKGNTLIVPSPQLRMQSLATNATRHPAILHTTGACSNPEYTNTKVGEKALFNHSYSAVLIEIDKDYDFHIRVLSSDVSGEFTDIGTKYLPDGSTEFDYPVAIVTGDEHAMFACPEVEKTTYTNSDSIIKTLKPKYVVRGDVLDMFSGNHHTRKDTIKNIGKNMFGLNRVEEELKLTVEYIRRTTVGEYENIMVASNHNDHLGEWLTHIDIKTEPWNAKIYFWLMYKVVDSMRECDTGVTHDNPFEIYCESVGLEQTRFLSRDESFRVADVELSMHGDRGVSGSRGSIAQFSNLADKVVIGHSHTPGIISGAYQVGTSSKLKLDYTSGPSSWMQTHCIVTSTGKRQLINIINGKWKA